jgi:hypothetical protein
MVNIDDNTRSLNDRNVLLNSITGEFLLEQFELASNAGSNPYLSIYNLNFFYWPNPNTYIQQGSSEFQLVYKTQGLCNLTTKPFTYQNQTVNCVALSIVIHKIMKEDLLGSRASTRYQDKKYHDKIFQECQRIQTSLNWGSDISLDTATEYLNNSPTNRIIYLDPKLQYPRIDKSGTEYIYDGYKKIIFLYYDVQRQHTMLISKPKALIKRLNKNKQLCELCWQTYLHSCDCTPQEPKVYNVTSYCSTCNSNIYEYKKHFCIQSACQLCLNVLDKETMDTHRCPITKVKPKKESPFIGEEGETKDSYNLIVYDLESCLKVTQLKTTHFTESPEFQFNTETEYTEVFRNEQTPNLVVWKNVFTGVIKHSTDIKKFIEEMILSNNGKNIVLAHNGSGYDTRFIYENVLNLVGKDKINLVAKGNRMLCLSVNDTKFQDSMMHLPGPLSKLAKDFLRDEPIELLKGYFPHHFNKEENYNYNGQIPDIKYFDLRFTIKVTKHQLKNRIKKNYKISLLGTIFVKTVHGISKRNY